MLPKPGVYRFPWEVSAGCVPDGGALRTFGRLSLYDVAQSHATLTAQHGPEQHHVRVCTKLVEPFQAQVGSLYMVLGELEHQKDGGCLVKARVLTCVEGVNLTLLEQAIRAQRLHRHARASGQQDGPAPGPEATHHADPVETQAQPRDSLPGAGAQRSRC